MVTRINDTNRPVQYRTWVLMQDTFGPDDAKWIIGIGALVSVDRPTHTFDTMNGGKHTIAGKPKIEVTTTTDKQRDMLMLKYGDRMFLAMEEYVLPNSISTCTLSDINWNRSW